MKNKFLTFLLLCISFCISVKAQRTIKGQICDADSTPMPGANIIVEGTSRGTISDIDGLFTLSLEKTDSIVLIQYIGYTSQRINISDKDTLKIYLQLEDSRLEEVVVVAYETQYSADISYSAQSVVQRVDFKKVEKNLATEGTWKRSGKDIGQATVMVGDKEHLEFKTSQIFIKIDGFRARVLIDYYFYNQFDKQVEGDFKYKLPVDASPYFFAFGKTEIEAETNNFKMPLVTYNKYDDYNFLPDSILSLRNNVSQLKRAYVVPKDNAYNAYSQTVNKAVDPAIAEWGGADLFNCRVFPLLPKSLNHIVIAYDVNLIKVGDKFTFEIPIIEKQKPEQILIDLPNDKDFNFEKNFTETGTNTNSRKIYTLENFNYKNIKIEELANQAYFLTSEKSDDKYFATFASFEIDAKDNSNLAPNAILALDVSYSSQPDKFNVWVKLALEILQKNTNTIKNFNLMLFNIGTYWWQNSYVENNSQNRRKLRKFLNSIVLIGATNISAAISESCKPNWDTQNSEKSVFILSDGDITWGSETDIKAEMLNVPNTKIFAYNTGFSGTNVSLLQKLCKQTSGGFFSIAGEAELAGAATAWTKKAWRIESVEMPNCNDILLAGNPSFLYPRQNLYISGRGTPNKDSELKIVLESEGVKKTLTIPVNKTIKSDLVARIYGQNAVSCLDEFQMKSYSEAYSMHFQVPGKTCSMLMLESESQYNDFHISIEEKMDFIQKKLVNLLLDSLKTKEVFTNKTFCIKTFIDEINKASANLSFEKTKELEELENLVDSLQNKFNFYEKLKILVKNKKIEGFSDILQSGNIDYDTVFYFTNFYKNSKDSLLKLEILSTLVEQNPGQISTLRDVAYSLMAFGYNKQALLLCRKILEDRKFEFISYFDMARAFQFSGEDMLAAVFYELIYAASLDNSEEIISAIYYKDLLRKISQNKKHILYNFASERLESIIKKVPCEQADIVVVMSWNSDNTDIDLHVTDPSGEVCNYQHTKTLANGFITHDITDGYGPEMFFLENAPEGKYEVAINYYNDDNNRMSGRSKVYISVIKNMGKPNQTIENYAKTLGNEKEHINVINFLFGTKENKD